MLIYNIVYNGTVITSCHNNMVIYKIRRLLEQLLGCGDPLKGERVFGINKECGLFFGGEYLNELKLAMALTNIEIQAHKKTGGQCPGFDKIVIPIFKEHGHIRFKILPKYQARKRGIVC